MQQQIIVHIIASLAILLALVRTIHLVWAYATHTKPTHCAGCPLQCQTNKLKSGECDKKNSEK